MLARVFNPIFLRLDLSSRMKRLGAELEETSYREESNFVGYMSRMRVEHRGIASKTINCRMELAACRDQIRERMHIHTPERCKHPHFS